MASPAAASAVAGSGNNASVPGGRDVGELTEEQKREILEAPPRGTWAIILLIGLAMLAGWLYFFFGLFMSHGPVA
jgi:hypothetical protein